MVVVALPKAEARVARALFPHPDESEYYDGVEDRRAVALQFFGCVPVGAAVG